MNDLVIETNINSILINEIKNLLENKYSPYTGKSKLVLIKTLPYLDTNDLETIITEFNLLINEADKLTLYYNKFLGLKSEKKKKR